MTEQPDLFDWTPPCRVLVFPLAARISRVREVAARYREKSPKQAVSYWRQVTDSMAMNFHRIGMVPADVECELDSFREAVITELHRMSAEPHRGGSEGNVA